MKKVVTAAVLVLTLGACNTPGERAVGGGLVGAGAGALIGGGRQAAAEAQQSARSRAVPPVPWSARRPRHAPTGPTGTTTATSIAAERLTRFALRAQTRQAFSVRLRRKRPRKLGMLGNIRTRTLKAFPEAAYREIVASLG